MIEETPIIEALVALFIAVLAYLTNKYRTRAADIELFYHPDTAHRVPPKVIATLKDTTWKINLSNIVYRVEYGQLVGALVKEE